MTTSTRWLLALLLIVGLAPVRAQRSLAGEIEIRQALQRLNTLGSAMMIAAHPDDENTALIAYLARGRHVRTAYLALTRGEGGQNLIGPEQGDEMGIIRTQELLAARRIDGGEQLFTRAIDFGFSKTADETLAKWQRDKVLADVVWDIRRFRPDVVILRFTGTPRDGHGHHQSSAILGREAFAAASDPTKFPEQLAYVQPWQPKRLMQNSAGGPGGGAPPGQAAPGQAGQAPGGRGGRGQQAPDGQPAAPPAGGGRGGRGGRGGGAANANAGPQVDVDLGEYSPELGYSYGEIAGMSRSQHRSQGMGAAERKGAQRNSLTTEVGDKATKDIFEGIDITWNRLPGGAAVGAAVQQALDAFVPAHPEELLPLLAQARPLIAAIKDPLAEQKLKELDETMALVAGVSLEAQADRFAVSPGATLRINVSAIVRSPVPVTLTGVQLTGIDGAPATTVAPAVLTSNQPMQYPLTVKVPENQPITQPYWLAQPKDGNIYSVPDQRLIGTPENAPVLEAHFRIRIAGTDLDLARPVQHKYVDRVYGELLRPLAIVPPVSLDLADHSLVFPNASARKVEVSVKSNGGKASGDVRLETPAGWRVTPATRHFDLAFTDEQISVSFDLTPPQNSTRGKLRVVAQAGNQTVSTSTEVILYSHIPAQTLFPPAEASLVRADIKILSKNVGYIMGAGDDVPAAIQQLGCEVTLLTPADLARGDLSKFDAIVTGVRAFNTRADLRANYQRLFDYASNGGTLVVQYNVAEGGAPGGGVGQAAPAGGATPAAATAAAAATPPPAGPPATGDAALLEHIGPYPIRTSRDRVTVEEAPITFPNPQLRILHAPNEITQADFDGWIQERGLYFADQWDPKYQSVLESHDPGEMPLPGGMLYTKLGKGAYVFSAYDWFRELPAGVPGAYRMFANMLSAAKTQ